LVSSEIRATKTGERVTVGPGHGGPGLSFFRPSFCCGTLLTQLGSVLARRRLIPPVSPAPALCRAFRKRSLKPGAPSPGFLFGTLKPGHGTVPRTPPLSWQQHDGGSVNDAHFDAHFFHLRCSCLAAWIEQRRGRPRERAKQPDAPTSLYQYNSTSYQSGRGI
jgi:hypothetical protein